MNPGDRVATAPGLTLSPERILQLLSEGEIEVEGLIPWSSNATLLVTIRNEEMSTLSVYKPQRGERPLWDFPAGSLGRREVAAYLVCEALGWGFIPPTILRNGPYGLGSVQFFVHAKENEHFFTIRHEPAYQEVLMRLAAYDVITNNADRKSGHCLVGHDGRLWAIDNALTFHVEYKLRTVIWEYAEQPLPVQVIASLELLAEALDESSELGQALVLLLSDDEVSALRRRTRRLIQAGCFPAPGPGRVVPWPLV